MIVSNPDTKSSIKDASGYEHVLQIIDGVVANPAIEFEQVCTRQEVVIIDSYCGALKWK
jgi:hypothetical protein